MKERLKKVLFEEESENFNEKIIIGDKIYELKKELTDDDIEQIENKKKIELEDKKNINNFNKRLILMITIIFIVTSIIAIVDFDRIKSFKDIISILLFLENDWLLLSISDLISGCLLILSIIEYVNLRIDLKSNIFRKGNSICILNIISLILNITFMVLYVYFFGINKLYAFIKLSAFVLLSIIMIAKLIHTLMKSLNKYASISEGLV